MDSRERGNNTSRSIPGITTIISMIILGYYANFIAWFIKKLMKIYAVNYSYMYLSLPRSQFCPEYRASQRHSYMRIPSTQVPPFSQGNESHSLASGISFPIIITTNLLICFLHNAMTIGNANITAKLKGAISKYSISFYAKYMICDSI